MSVAKKFIAFFGTHLPLIVRHDRSPSVSFSQTVLLKMETIASCRGLLCALVLLGVYFKILNGQYGTSTYQYQLGMTQEQELLKEQVQSLPDVNYYYYPQRQYFSYSNTYTFDFLTASSYRIGILIDPCRFNAYNCCMNGLSKQSLSSKFVLSQFLQCLVVLSTLPIFSPALSKSDSINI